MSFEGVAVVAAAPLVVPVAGSLVAVAGVALAASAAVAVASAVIPVAVRGAVAGTELAIQTGSALAKAVDTAITDEIARQQQAYQARFERATADRSEAIASLKRQLVQRTAPEKAPNLNFR